MATSYKIRLKRFNGLDYDTLNLLSENIIRNNGNTVEQEFNNIIPSSNGMLKNNNGVFNVATLGTDYGALTFTITLLSTGWSNNTQTINNNNFVSTGYSYSISPNPDDGSFSLYGEAQIYANNVTVDGQMTFNCDSAPSSNLTVIIERKPSA